MRQLRHLHLTGDRREVEDRRPAEPVVTPIAVGLGLQVTRERAGDDRAVKRDAYIAVDDEIKGGTPVIRGTRITVYSVLGRIEHGDTIDDVLADNPDLTREAIEAGIIYARTYLLVGRPGGRPWVSSK